MSENLIGHLLAVSEHGWYHLEMIYECVWEIMDLQFYWIISIFSNFTALELVWLWWTLTESRRTWMNSGWNWTDCGRTSTTRTLVRLRQTWRDCRRTTTDSLGLPSDYDGFRIDSSRTQTDSGWTRTNFGRTRTDSGRTRSKSRLRSESYERTKPDNRIKNWIAAHEKESLN